MDRTRRDRIVLMLAALGACAVEPEVDPRSVDVVDAAGRPFPVRALEASVRSERHQDLLDARRDHLDALVWYGRRTAYLGRHREAIAIYTRGIEMHAFAPHPLRHRGHRHLTVREFDAAIADLAAAVERLPPEDEIEPDGLPNARGVPRTTLFFNVHYHLGLAHFFARDWGAAESAFRDTLEVARTSCRNDDAACAARYWLVHSLVRQGKRDEAVRVLDPVHRSMDLLENHAYHRLLLLYKGELEPEVLAREAEDPTIGFGWARYHVDWLGDRERGRGLLQEVVARRKRWDAFGFIAAERDLAN